LADSQMHRSATQWRHNSSTTARLNINKFL
jgi:hypothetical protein